MAATCADDRDVGQLRCDGSDAWLMAAGCPLCNAPGRVDVHRDAYDRGWSCHGLELGGVPVVVVVVAASGLAS